MKTEYLDTVISDSLAGGRAQILVEGGHKMGTNCGGIGGHSGPAHGTLLRKRWTKIHMVGGLAVGGWFRKYYHFVAPSCKLELARFSA